MENPPPASSSGRVARSARGTGTLGQNTHHQFTLKSPLSPDQLRVLTLYHQCGVKIDNKTFISIWKLVNLGIPPSVIVDFLRDIAPYKK